MSIESSREWEDRYRNSWSWDETVKVTHPQDCYPGNCSFVAYKRDGKIIREEQTGKYPPVDSDTPDWNPRGCNKGCLYSDVTYGEERIKQPMKQTGPRGSGEWEPISWDQAYREIADSLLDALEENPQSIVLEPPVEGGTFQAMASSLLFTNLLGGTVLDEVAEISDFSAGLYTTFGKFHLASSVDEWFKSGINIIWHMNPVYTRIPSYHFLTENRYQGGELVTISPDYNPSCVHADQYIPVNPASDAALALGMCKVILDEEWENRSFLRTQTDLPLLVKKNSGRFLRPADLGKEDGDSFYVWDDKLGISKAPTDNLDAINENTRVFTSRTIETANETLEVATVGHLLREKLDSEYSMQSIQESTGVHPDVMRELARKVSNKKTNILLGFNTCKTFHGDLIERSMCLLLALTGNWGKPGTGIRSWNVVSEPGMPYGGVEDGFKELAKLKQSGESTTAEKLSIQSNMIQAALGFPTVPPVFFWYNHCGYDQVWSRIDSDDLNLPRPIDDYVEEAIEQEEWKSVNRPKSEVDPNVLFTIGNNTLRRTRGGTRTLLHELWPKLDTVITVDFRWSTTALYSDIVLPAAFFYEKEQFHMLTSSENRFWSYSNQAIDPVHNSRSEWNLIRQLTDVLCERAKQRGIDTFEVPHGVTSDDFERVIGRRFELPDELNPLLGTKRSIEDVKEFVTQGGQYDQDGVEEAMENVVSNCRDAGLFDEDETLESIRERGFVKYQGLGDTAEGQNMATDVESDETVTALENHVKKGQPYPTLTGRAQFYIDHEWFLEADEQLPRHKDPPGQGGDYPFRMDSGHQRWSIHASTVVNEQMAQTHRGEPFVFVNEQDAKELNVKDGELVEVLNDYGSFQVQAKISALPEPGQLIIYHAWDPHQYVDWKSYDHIIPGLIKPLHLASGYGHLNYWISNWQPQQVDRHVRVDIRPVEENDE